MARHVNGPCRTCPEGECVDFIPENSVRDEYDDPFKYSFFDSKELGWVPSISVDMLSLNMCSQDLHALVSCHQREHV